jgi:HK97 family phage portal protein
MRILGKNFGKRNEEKRDFSYISPYSDALMFGNATTKNSALAISAVYSAVNLISDSVATLPIQIKIKNDKGKDIVENNPLYGIFENDLMSRYTFIKSIVQNVILKGNGFAYIERDKQKKVIGLRYLPAEDVQIYYSKEKKELYYNCGYIFKGRIYPKDMLHFLRYTTDGVTGISVLSYARRSLNITNQTENSAETFFSSGCNLNGILTVNSNLSEKQKADIKTSWSQAYSGNTGGGLAVLQGNMTYQPISMSSTDAQMLESRQFNVEDIARFFSISPILLGDLSHSSYSSIEATNIQYLSYTLNPYIVMIEQELNRKLVGSGSNISINLDETEILRTNKQETSSYYSSMLNAGVLSINEVRKELGYNSVDGGDSHNIPYSDTSKTNINQNPEPTTNSVDNNDKNL